MSGRAATASEIERARQPNNHIEGNGEIVSHGVGCPLAALTGKDPGVCLADGNPRDGMATPVRESL